jgi:uncharacterized protein (DUF488 family)
MEVYTAGFTKWLAKDFFNELKKYKIQLLIDIRRRPNSQLSGYTKSDNFEYFLKELSGVRYLNDLDLAPSKELLYSRRKEGLDWNNFSLEYINQLNSKKLDNCLETIYSHKTLFLCSETLPDNCHRKLLVDKLYELDNNISVIHLSPFQKE